MCNKSSGKSPTILSSIVVAVTTVSSRMAGFISKMFCTYIIVNELKEKLCMFGTVFSPINYGKKERFDCMAFSVQKISYFVSNW
jgi:hypothetical protein